MNDTVRLLIERSTLSSNLSASDAITWLIVTSLWSPTNVPFPSCTICIRGEFSKMTEFSNGNQNFRFSILILFTDRCEKIRPLVSWPVASAVPYTPSGFQTLHETLRSPGITSPIHLVRSKDLPFSIGDVDVANRFHICRTMKPVLPSSL